MTTNALVSEARKLDAEATPSGNNWLAGVGFVHPLDGPWIVRSRTLLPQLADALEAAEAAVNEAEWRAKAELSKTITGQQMQIGELEARLAKVLPLAVETIQVVRGGEWVR